MTKTFHTILLTLLILLTSMTAQAITETDKSIASIGVGTSIDPLLGANIKPAEPLSSDCLYGLLYFDINSASGKAMYSTLLMAVAGAKKLSRIDYFQNKHTGVCILTYTEISQ